MPYFETIQEWTRESSLLLKARPTTTRITTKYSLQPRPAKSTSVRQRSNKKRKVEEGGEAGKTTSTSTAPPPPPTDAATATATATATTSSTNNNNTSIMSSDPPKASLTLKTYDPVSGACLKYRTFRAAEVGRLIGGLGELGKGMAGLTSSGAEGSSSDDGIGGDGGGKRENEDHAMPDAPATAEISSTVKSTGSTGAGASVNTAAKSTDKPGQSSGGAGSSAGGKKKKKGKK